MNAANERLIANVRKWRDHRPEIVDDLIAALELVEFHPTMDRYEDQWLNRVCEMGLLNQHIYYVYLDFLTCEG